MQKRLIIVTLITFLLVSLIGLISAASCRVDTVGNCNTAGGENIVMGLTASTNAHGEFPYVNYPYVLCCDFGSGNTSCVDKDQDGIYDNKIIGLSASTNAHAEVPSETNYPVDVCYKNIECKSSSSTCGTGDVLNYPIPMLSLSASTNAHLANYSGTGSYPVKICCKFQSPVLACSLTNAFWSKDGVNPIIVGNDSVMEGNQVYLVVEGTNCNGVSVSFEVFEDDEGPATNQPEGATFNGDKAIGTWTAEWVDDGAFQGDPEYYFNARVYGNEQEMVQSNDPLLTVYSQESVGFSCGEINLCSDYTDQESCNSDTCDVASSDPNCDPSTNCACSWDSGTCKFASSGGALCGNNIIDAGEQCDGANWGSITGCSDFDEFTGGILSCINCKFNTANCTGRDFGPCGNNVINLGETCDGTDWGPITNCSDFNDFTDGTLTCDDTCQFNTSLCTGGEGWDTTKTQGTCVYVTSTDDDCSDGYLSYSWTATWEGSGEKPDWCQDGSRIMECPAQAKLPFFNFYHLIIALAIIAAIYYFLTKKKLFKIKKKKSRKKKRAKKK